MRILSSLYEEYEILSSHRKKRKTHVLAKGRLRDDENACEARRKENRFNASVRLQSTFRGHRQRKKFRVKYSEVSKEREEKIFRSAATTIQRFGRGLLVRKRFSLFVNFLFSA